MTHIKTFLRQLISQSCLLTSNHLLNVTNIRHHEFRVVCVILVYNTANLDNSRHNKHLWNFWHRTSTNNSQQVPVIDGGMLGASLFASVHGMAYMHPFSRFISLITISSPLLARRRRLRATLSHICAHTRWTNVTFIISTNLCLPYLIAVSNYTAIIPIDQPLQILLVNRIVTNWTLAPAAFFQRHVVQYARPAVDVTTACYLRCST